MSSQAMQIPRAEAQLHSITLSGAFPNHLALKEEERADSAGSCRPRDSRRDRHLAGTQQESGSSFISQGCFGRGTSSPCRLPHLLAMLGTLLFFPKDAKHREASRRVDKPVNFRALA